jgi:RsiW-degrading membrane proteinase PrsW (M82 family)
MDLQLVLAVLIAAGIPLIFLVIIYALDLYASRTFRLVLACFAWGAIGGVGLAYLAQKYISVPLLYAWGLRYFFLYVAFAPIVEEIAKSLSILYVARRPEFTYFVDGAIYGFASGIGFSIVENYLYIQQNPRQGITIALVRAFSVCLMHGTAAGLVGAAVGRFRFRRGTSRGLASLSGWVAAVLLHALFNGISQSYSVSENLVTPLLVGIGMMGVALIGFFINRGLKEQGEWLIETLNRQTAMSGAEARAARALGSIDAVLEPLANQFPNVAEQILELVLKQAQLGIKRKVHQEIDDARMKEKLGEEIAAMQADMEKLRKEIGPYVMAYVRAVFPENKFDVWGRLETLAVQSGPPDLQRWADMLTASEEKPAQRSIFARLQTGPAPDAPPPE